MNGTTVLTTFTADTKDFDNKIKNVDNKTNAFAKGVGTAFKVAATTITAAATAVGVLVKKSVEAYAEFEQLEGGLEAMFGKGSKEMTSVLQTSESAWKDLTMSQNEYLNSFQNSYALVKNGMKDQSKSIEYTNKAIQLSSDLFNTYGGSVETYQSAINWALKGSFNYIDNLNLGIKGTQEGFVEAANNAGILGRTIKDVKELTNEEIIDVIQHYADETGAWGRTQKEAADTIQGSLKMTKAAWENFVSGMAQDGADIDVLIDNLVNSAVTFGNNIIPVIERALEGIAKALPKIVEKISQVLPSMIQNIVPPLVEAIRLVIDAIIKAVPPLLKTAVPVLIQALIEVVKSLAQALPDIITAIVEAIVVIAEALANEAPTLIPIVVNAIIDALISLLENVPQIINAGMSLLMGLIQGIVKAIPILIAKAPLIITSIISALLQALPQLIMMAPQIIVSIITGLIEAIPMLIEMAPQIITGIINGLKNGFVNMLKTGKDIIKKMWDGISQAVPNMLSKIPGIPKSVVEKVKEGFSKIGDVGKNLVKGLWNGIKNVKDWILGKIKGFVKGITDGIKNFFGIKSPSKVMAKEVGQWIPKGLAVGIDANTDAVDKSVASMQKDIVDSFQLSPQLTNSSALHYSPNVVVNNEVNVKQDPLGQMVRDVKTFSGGAKNDFNYGMGV